MSGVGGGGWRAALERWLIGRWYGAAPAWPLLPLVPLFIVLSAAARAWQRLRAERLPVPVVVVGNLTVGGTGKTPFVIWLIDQLRAQGRTPGVVSRGYGGATRAPRAVDADATAAAVGDEPLLIARRTGAPVFVGADRLAAARALLAAHPATDVVISDDGLQHLRLARAVEVVVVDGPRGLGNGWRLPAGPLREAAGRLATVDLVVVNGTPRAPLPVASVAMRLEPGPVRALGDGERRPLAAFAGGPVHALAGIGNPGRFFAMLRAAGLAPIEHPRPDHAALGPADLPPADGLPLLLTEKDAIKLEARPARPEVWAVPVAAELDAADAAHALAVVAARIGRG